MTAKAATPTRFRVGLVQMFMSADPGAILAKAMEKVWEAAAQGAAVVVVPLSERRAAGL